MRGMSGVLIASQRTALFHSGYWARYKVLDAQQQLHGASPPAFIQTVKRIGGIIVVHSSWCFILFASLTPVHLFSPLADTFVLDVPQALI